MSIWRDPILPIIPIPEDLKTKQFRLGSYRYSLLPKQYELLSAHEEFIGYIGGYGSGKTRIGALKSAYISTECPNNRGIVGRLNGTDLEDTSQRDLLDILRDAELLKEAPNAKNRRALVHCIDLKTNRNLGYESEISFAHLDDPDHLRGRHLGWAWIDEGSEVKQRAWQNLIGRLRLPAYRGAYQAFVTGNPEGHNWIYEFFFNPDILLKMICGKPGCPYSDKVCNERMRKKRRAIHCTSYENYYLPPEYIDQMVSSYTDEQRKRYVEASFDVFEGQIFKEFSHDLHVIDAPPDWIDGRPPKEWMRLIAVDVGGASPWAFEWVAVDPWDNVIFCDEIYKISTNVDQLAEEALPKMMGDDHKPYTFRAKVIDYENKVAAEDLRRRGIAFTNAAKHGKAGSIHRLASYLHPHPAHHFPPWHPRAGQPHSPRLFIVASQCPNLIREFPQQRWKEDLTNERMKDEADRTVANHAVDCALYIARELPEVAKLKPTPGKEGPQLSLMSRMYYADVKKREEEMARPAGGSRVRPVHIDMLF